MQPPYMDRPIFSLKLRDERTSLNKKSLTLVFFSFLLAGAMVVWTQKQAIQKPGMPFTQQGGLLRKKDSDLLKIKILKSCTHPELPEIFEMLQPPACGFLRDAADIRNYFFTRLSEVNNIWMVI